MSRGIACEERRPLGLFCTGVSGEELFSVCLFLPPLLFPYCSALYDNVVVNRVYSELALGWTSKPQWTPRRSLGFNRAGLVAVLCKCIVLSLPADSEKSEQQLSFFTATSVPFHFGSLAQFSQKHSHMWLSHRALLPGFCESSGSRESCEAVLKMHI